MGRTIDTGTEQCTAEVADGVAVITLNRPEARNAMSGEMNAGLRRALDDVETAIDVRCVVLTGAGGAFCAGGDVKGFAEGSVKGGGSTIDEKVHQQRIDQRMTAGRLHLMPKPTVAVIPGPAAGAGLSMALACDLRISLDTAIITTAFAKVGFSGDYGGTAFLTQLVGSAKAKELYYLSDRLTGAEAVQLGLVNWAFPAAEFEAGWREIVGRLATGPSIAHRYMKENINRAAAGVDVLDCMDLEVTHHIHCGHTEDHLNASKAFVEKRQPEFKGR